MHSKFPPTAKQIDALLPQTQCGLCGYKGCMPYAEALANNEAHINLCPPGGVKGLRALATILKKDPSPFITEMEQKTKMPSIAVIREAECIGCTKCIQACPVDAILGAAKQMHTVITTECTGCELCIAPCPVDCIDILSQPNEENTSQRDHYRSRYHAREARLQSQQKNSLKNSKLPEDNSSLKNEKEAYIQAALLRVKAKQNR